jgi:hypothetical protein
MNRIAKELREHHAALGFSDSEETWLTAAADEIERLREALHQIAGKVSQSDKSFDGDMASDIARAALGEGKE